MKWTYKGHQCEIWEDDDGDVIKAWHQVITPEGKLLMADISPYLWSSDLVNMWIDAGYPKRISGGPLDEADLKKIGPMDKLTALVRFGRRI